MPRQDPVWQQLEYPDASLSGQTLKLQRVSEELAVRDWKRLARYLDLKESTIDEIDEDHKSSSKERKYQMLHKWSQCQGDGATPKALLECVEFELGDRKMAQRIVDTLKRGGTK